MSCLLHALLSCHPSPKQNKAFSVDDNVPDMNNVLLCAMCDMPTPENVQNHIWKITINNK